MKYKTVFVIVTPSALVLIPPPVRHWIGGSSAARRDEIAAELEKLES